MKNRRYKSFFHEDTLMRHFIFSIGSESGGKKLRYLVVFAVKKPPFSLLNYLEQGSQRPIRAIQRQENC